MKSDEQQTSLLSVYNGLGMLKTRNFVDQTRAHLFMKRACVRILRRTHATQRIQLPPGCLTKPIDLRACVLAWHKIKSKCLHALRYMRNIQDCVRALVDGVQQPQNRTHKKKHTHDVWPNATTQTRKPIHYK